MQEPGLDKHEWESEWQGLEGSVADAPLEALSELDDLIARMMEARGFPLEEREGKVETEPETVREFLEARRIMQLADTGETVDPATSGSRCGPTAPSTGTCSSSGRLPTLPSDARWRGSVVGVTVVSARVEAIRASRRTVCASEREP